MKPSSAFALFILAVITECLGAQSERSRQRSGPIRSVPVAADIKRDTDFDCPEEFGYYPHPNDCTLYYVCVFGGALLESCTGGLMYSHELQTCDWPRNVGCDGTSAAGGEELERISERDRDPPPPPLPPRRTPPPPPPPPPRAQPNPVVTSRGQPKFNRDDYEKQQQLYAEVDDLPPVEEIENDRQQRVYRGQPSTIGQVQKDRDGYGSQVVNSRTLNANIIPASVPQNSGKVGSFSFGTQVEERRTATATQAPQTYSEDKHDTVTDFQLDRQSDIETNKIDENNKIKNIHSRKKRDTTQILTTPDAARNSTKHDNAADRNDREIAFVEVGDNEDDIEDTEDDDEIEDIDDFERGKRQIRYYLQKGYKNPGKNWQNSKPIRFVDIQQFNYNPNIQNANYQVAHNALNSKHNNDATRKPYSNDNNNIYSTANPFAAYHGSANENHQSYKTFIPSLRDPFERLPHAPMNIATQIITKSPPISSLVNNNENKFPLRNENPFAALAGGFYNNIQTQNFDSNQLNQKNKQYSSHFISSTGRPNNQHQNLQNNQATLQDSSLLPSTVVTDKPVKFQSTSQRPKNSLHPAENQAQNGQNAENYRYKQPVVPSNHRPVSQEYEYEDEEDEKEEDEEESNEDENDDFKHDFPDPPYEFTHPSNKYAEIENPFASPNFDFDAFLAKLRGETTIRVTSPKPQSYNNHQNTVGKGQSTSPDSSPTSSSYNSGYRSTTTSHQGMSMSTPRPFTVPTGSIQNTNPVQNNFNSVSTTENSQKFLKLIQQSFPQQNQQQSYNQNVYSHSQQNAGTPINAIRPKLKPPNFKDDRQLPLSYDFQNPAGSTTKPNYENTKDNRQVFTVTQKPYIFMTATGTPITLSTPKQQYIIKPENIISYQPHLVATGKPYLVSSIKPHNAYAIFKQSTSRPLSTPANEQLSALQNYWTKNPSTEFYLHSTPRPISASDIPKLESLFAQAIRSSTTIEPKKEQVTTSTTLAPPKRKPIPKPSPEMNDYYYDDDEHYYYEPPVKSKYMPSTEVKPQRPPMAQNYQEYEDDDDDDSSESPVTNKPVRTQYRRPTKYNSFKPESATKNHNDVSVVTKSPLKESNKYSNGKIPIPVLVNYGTPAPNVLMRPEIATYQIMHNTRNRTLHYRKPTSADNGPFTIQPPKYLNKTTLRPYTVRHRLAKPTTVKDMTTQSEDAKQTRGRMRHHNIVAQMKLTTPRDSQKQETQFTKTRHDDKTNSLDPTESVTPSSYASPRPKMLYNGSQAYSPDQYDPYYAVYDEDGELYKDTEYVQQYNVASLRPAVQQTYRGTPPPPQRRPVETYTPRPSQEDYDDAALIHGQINNQNQYQTPIRHSTRGEGNELGYDNNPSSVKTTVYEATSISTTPSTTSTTSTTQRPTIAPFTEAMTPSRYTPRSPTDESPIRVPDSSSENPSDGSTLSIPSSPMPMINISSLAKPFEKTDNSYRLQDTLTSTERLTPGLLSYAVNNYQNRVNSANLLSHSKDDNKKAVSLTTGFSFRRNSINSNNPYTLTVLTRPFDHFNKTHLKSRQQNSSNYYKDSNDAREVSIESQEDTYINSRKRPLDASDRRKDSSPEISSVEADIPVFINSPKPKTILKPKIIVASTPSPGTTKYYLKTVIKRPAPFSTNDEEKTGSTENNNINTDVLIETVLQNARASEYLNQQINSTTTTEAPKWGWYKDLSEKWNKPTVSPYRSLDNLRQSNKYDVVPDYTTSTAATTRYTTVVPKDLIRQYVRTDGKTTSKPAYYSYRVVDEEIPDQTTEVFSGAVKNIIKAFFDNFSITPNPNPQPEIYSNTSPRISTTDNSDDKVVNIGFQKKTLNNDSEKPLKSNAQRLQIVSEPNLNKFVYPSIESTRATQYKSEAPKGFSSTTMQTAPVTDAPIVSAKPETTSLIFKEHSQGFIAPNRKYGPSKFGLLVTSRPEASSVTPITLIENSRKFHKLVNAEPSLQENQDKSAINNNIETEVTKFKSVDSTKQTDFENNRQNKLENEIATTTSTTKSTTVLHVSTTSTTKSISFPTRASRVNPAIKLAATNPGGGRRSYQSSSKCSSDNSLQANPKCNEIKYQRPSSTRGRGSAHYSTLSGSDVPQQQNVNRGTPPTRSRPTLKPSTAVVTNNNPVVDVYAHPPRRPAPVYPQPTPDKTAAKCRKDVCLLPDCYCGGKDIPGDLPVESVPQIVLLTFDDSVNDLNKGLYTDLFEKGRVNPNGCPITATFYVSHEWTDYSQVQNLYSAGHEMASHTISHSFGEQFSQKKWNREVGGQREILAAYGGVKLEDVRGMRAPFLSVGGNKMFKMLYDSNFTYDSSMPVYENRPPSWPYTLDYKLFHDCMIPPCPTKSYPGVWEVPMVMWQDLNGGRCSMGDACANPPEAEGVYKMLLKNFDRHYTTNRAPFGLFYHAAWFTQPHHKEGFIMFLDFINQMPDVWIVTNWQALQWVRDPTPISRLNNFQPFQCNYQGRPKKCNNPKVCNLWHKSGVRYMRTCQPCPEVYPWTGKTGIKSSRIDNDIEE